MAKHLALLLFVLGCIMNLTSAAEKVPDLEAAASVASDYKVQSVVATGSNGKYGYPYLVAPTLAPVIQARSDDDEKETVPVVKSYGSRISGATDDTVKKGNQKKSKVYGATRRQDEGNDYIDKFFRNYREPKYRNFEELEADFLPKRRIDTSIAYSQYEYPKPGRKPSISSRDPYLSPSPEPLDGFYPSSSPKIKNGYSSYGSHSNRDVPSYGAGKYEDPLDYHSDSYAGPSPSYPSSGGSSLSYPSSGGSSLSYPSSGGSSLSYPSSGGPSSSYSSSGGSPLSYPSSGGSSLGYPSSGGPSSSYQSGSPYNYHGDYSIKSNEPIMGDIRKKLLDYAGASDHYEGEPDYFREVARNKYKYGNLGNDYYTYGGQGHRDSYRDFPYVESKITLIKKSRGQ